MVSGFFSDLRSPKIRTVYCGPGNDRYFFFSVHAARGQKSANPLITQNLEFEPSSWQVSRHSSRTESYLNFVYCDNDYVMPVCPCNTRQSPTPKHQTYVELHLRPTARLRWLLPQMEAIEAAAPAPPPPPPRPPPPPPQPPPPKAASVAIRHRRR